MVKKSLFEADKRVKNMDHTTTIFNYIIYPSPGFNFVNFFLSLIAPFNMQELTLSL